MEKFLDKIQSVLVKKRKYRRIRIGGGYGSTGGFFGGYSGVSGGFSGYTGTWGSLENSKTIKLQVSSVYGNLDEQFAKNIKTD